MEVLRVGAEACARVVEEHAPVLLGERQRERLERRRILRDRDRLGHLGQIERAEELRPQRLRLGPRTTELLLQPPQGALVTFEQLHLELAEAAHDVDAVEHGDVVLDDLGAGCAQPLSSRPQTCDGDELAPVQMGDESEVISCGGRAGGPACSSSMRCAPCGSFSCHSPAPSSRR